MFESLRKKLTDTIKGFAKREETKSAETVIEKPPAAEKQEVKPLAGIEKQVITERQDERRKAEIEKPPAAAESHKAEIEKPVAERHEAKPKAEAEKRAAVERQEGPKIDLKLTTKIKKIFVNRITLSSAEIDGFAESLKEPMLRSDVSYGTTDEFIRDLKGQLAGMQISSGRIDEEVTNVVRGALMQILDSSSPKAGLAELVAQHIAGGASPVKILFLGPNGAGKTTTIAKLAYNFKVQGLSSVLSASDTFRAAAIEQLELHAKRIGVPIIKSKYGADPASVAFDAIAHAKSKGIQLVLIDSAGRQETNKSLISEIEKIVRVCKPDITIFIGESTAGNVISEQISEFGKHVRIDGIILTKLDCDAKGGSALSIAKVTGVPILFFGTGEGYDALMPYSSEFIVNAILPAS
jgi:fused signal recognition particle receptor